MVNALSITSLSVLTAWLGWGIPGQAAAIFLGFVGHQLLLLFDQAVQRLLRGLLPLQELPVQFGRLLLQLLKRR